MRPQGEEPSLHPVSGRDPLGFVLDYLKLFQMGGGHLGDPDGGSIVKDVAHDGLICGHQGFGRKAPARPS